MSRLSNTNRPLHRACPTTVWDAHSERNKLVGPHTLMNLGYYAGVNKGDFGESAGWEVYSEEMLEYCVQDVLVNTAVYHYLLKELTGFSDYCIDLEMDIAGYMAQQQANGWVFDLESALRLEADLAEKVFHLEEEVHRTFKPLAKQGKLVQPRVKKSGEVSSVGLKFLEDWESVVPRPLSSIGAYGIEYHSGRFTRITWPEFNLGSRQQIAEQLIHRGWKPTVFTDKGSIIINEPVLAAVEDKFPEAKLLGEYFMVSKRQSMVQNWIESYNEDTGRLNGYTNSLGTITGRMSMSKPNLQQVPASSVDKEGHIVWGFEGAYGADCRNLFTVPKGYVQIGADASGLELRTLSHYLNDPEYTKQVVDGDIHTYNQKAAGLPFRSMAKTMIYCWLYGGGDAKLGAVVGGGAEEGKALKKKLMANIPALKVLKDNVTKASERGWIKALDGRIIKIRSSHSALNFLLQGAGAIVMKVYLRIVIQKLEASDVTYKLVGTIHDEVQLEVLHKDEDYVKSCLVNSFREAGEELKTRCPIDGEAMSGSSWAFTH